MYRIIISVTSYMLWPLIVAIFKEMFFSSGGPLVSELKM
jgi:hypothetical protein